MPKCNTPQYGIHSLALFAFLVTMVTVLPASATQKGFYVIAHQRNTVDSIDHAMSEGANAVEIDLQFDSDANPAYFRHGHPCDCDCYKVVSDKPYICTLPNVCSRFTQVEALLEHLSNYPQIALIWIDSKTYTFTHDQEPHAALALFGLVERHLFNKGYKGHILIGSPNAMLYLETLANLALASPYKSKFFFSIDQVKNDPIDIINKLTNSTRFPTRSVIYDNGLTACAPLSFYTEILVGAVNQLNGVVSDVYAWTVDSTASFDAYWESGVGGFITNRIHNLMEWVKKKGIPLAKPGDDTLKPATGDKVIHVDCNCKHSNNDGCIVTKPAPPNSACHCKSYGTACTGTVVMCKHRDAAECKNPGTSVAHCVQGGGDCDGYPNRCDCQYFKGGCKITKKAHQDTACYCGYVGAWTCKGYNVACLDQNAPLCKQPSKSLQSCVLAGGNCDAYEPTKCKCYYHSGGCLIGVAAPLNTACQCVYEGAWTCSGYVVRCKDVNSPLCKNPDTSKASCLLGGGDCNAYKFLSRGPYKKIVGWSN